MPEPTITYPLSVLDEGARVLPDQPPPKPGHGDVILEVIESGDVQRAMQQVAPGGALEHLVQPRARYLLSLALAAAEARDLGVDLLDAFVERRQDGISVYGTTLQRGNGRLHHVDAIEEYMDAAVYTRAQWPEDG